MRNHVAQHSSPYARSSAPLRATVGTTDNPTGPPTGNPTTTPPGDDNGPPPNGDDDLPLGGSDGTLETLAVTGPSANVPLLAAAGAAILAGLGLIATSSRLHRTKP